MTTTVLAGIAGTILALFFEWVPGVESWFGKLKPVGKRLVMSVSLIVAAVFVYGMACLGILGDLNWTLTCDETGLTKLLGILFAALASNQTFHSLIKKG